jgi:hypothetical protein
VRNLPSWVTSKTLVLLSAALVLVIVAAVIFTLGFRGGSGQGSGNPTADSNVVLTVDQAKLAEAGQNIRVSGHIVSTGGNIVLASALAESDPPQAGGASLPVSGLTLKELVGLSSTAGQAGAADVTWSDYVVVLEGVLVKGVFEVRAVPPVEEETTGDITVRFSPVNGPVSSGDQVWWALDATNGGQEAVDLTFSDGQRGDIILDDGNDDVYIWSDGKAFDQAVKTVTLEPGQSFPAVLNDTLNVKAGQYNLTARITAMVGPEDSAAPLPDISAAFTVH